MAADSAAKYFPGREIGLNPASDANFERARQWLHECLASHHLCVSRSAQALPTRLIDIGDGISPQDPVLFIPTAGTNGRYAALSYCWGTAQNNILTKENLRDKMQSIRLFDLPKTIYDAAKITRKLGLQYLWVDALCIIQDSVEDWQRESANMENIYSNAFITIQASGAKDTQTGCFVQRVVQDPPPAKLRFQSEDGSVGSVFIRYQPVVDIEVDPLHQRGWTLQESLLSPRIISYGSRQMWWECRTKHYSEGGCLLQDQGFFPGLPKPFRTKTKNHLLPLDFHTHDPTVEKQLTWSYITRDYASRNLTFSKDKLPALSGLARCISKTRPGDTYLAGMWKSEIPGNLLWGVTKDCTKPSIYRAPSWSWASLDGDLAVFGRTYYSTDDYCEALGASVTPSGPDTFGEVSEGMITLRGPLKQGWRILDERTLRGDVRVQYLYEDDRRLLPSENTFRLKLGLCELDLLDSDQKLGYPVSTWCLRITNLEGLVLQVTQSGAFQRIGCFGLDEDKIGWFKESDVQILAII
jgi:hypothetical protein